MKDVKCNRRRASPRRRYPPGKLCHDGQVARSLCSLPMILSDVKPSRFDDIGAAITKTEEDIDLNTNRKKTPNYILSCCHHDCLLTLVMKILI